MLINMQLERSKMSLRNRNTTSSKKLFLAIGQGQGYQLISIDLKFQYVTCKV